MTRCADALTRAATVMSECAACHTPAEGLALIRAVEETGRVYLFAENYPYMAYNQEMRRLYREGTVGTFRGPSRDVFRSTTTSSSVIRALDLWQSTRIVQSK